jgi:hypothetical protein
MRVESLEGRALLSGMKMPIPEMPALVMRHDSGESAATRGPVSGIGFVVKADPRFYGLYKGAKLPQFNVIAASGVLVGSKPGGTFKFTGAVEGQLSKSTPTVFVFGINRGSGSEPGPFQNRAGVVFDSVVVVSIGPNGVSGSVHASGVNTTLDPKDVQVVGNQVRVDVPSKLLPSTGSPLGQYRFNLWVNNPNAMGEQIASFAPENSDIQVLDLR